MSIRLNVPNEQPPVGDDEALVEWLTRLNILTNAALNSAWFQMDELNEKIIDLQSQIDILHP